MAMFGGYLNPRAAAAGAVGGGAVVSGSVGADAVQSGAVGSGAVTGQAGGGNYVIASGTITTNDIGSGAIRSGLIGSGQIGSLHIGSGQLTGFELGSGSIVSGRVASGHIGSYHFSSGAVVDRAQCVAAIISGINRTPAIITEEVISGLRAVNISQSGNIRIAMASVSGRMPAVGFVVDNVLSGMPATVYTQGAFQTTSGLADYSGYLGKPVWVGRSGQIVTWSGSFNSGGLNVLSGGDFIQRIGVSFIAGTATTGGAFLGNVVIDMGQNQLLAATAITDVNNRAFGV